MKGRWNPRVGIIGAGLGGIAMAVNLRRRGLHDFVILEQSEGFGGTWLDNSYPGAEVDVPSELYSYSFKSWRWSRSHAGQPELLSYISAVVDEYGLRKKMRLGVKVRAVEWDDQADVYRVVSDFGETFEFDVVISAVGQLNNPHIPDWPGLDSFRGEVFHTARWPKDACLEGKNVAVVGTGSSCSQVVPQLAQTVDGLTVFQRQPGWVLPKEDRDYDEAEIERLSQHGLVRAGRRLRNFYWMERLRKGSFAGSPTNRRLQERATRHLEETVTDPEVRRLLTPDYPFYCKRPILSSNYLESFNRPNVNLIASAVASVTPTGLVDTTGRHTSADVIVLATGFQATNILGTFDVRGQHAQGLHTRWGVDPRAFLGLMVPGFPNFFMMYGPNTNNGSILYLLERQAEWIAAKVRKLSRRSEPRRLLLIRPWLHDRYNSWLDKANADQSWSVGGCGNYYTSASGRIVTQFPRSMLRYRMLLWTTSGGWIFDSAAATPRG